MVFSRVGTAICLLLLLAFLALADITAVNKLELNVPHGQNIHHSQGIIESIDSHQDFVLTIAEGHNQRFHCSQHCLYQWSHLTRHYYEYALTDVYYVSNQKGELLAIDAD